MKTVIAGSRSATKKNVFDAMDFCGWRESISAVLSGGSRGADKWGEEWAREKGLPVRRFLAHWSTFGKAAGPMRNREMAESADALVAIWDGKSPGTGDMIRRASDLGLIIFIWRIDG